MSAFNQVLDKLANHQNLDRSEAEESISAILRGEIPPAQIAAFLVALRSKGETLVELQSFARSLREAAIQVHLDEPFTVDLCGTGGDKSGTFNISTAAMFVVAGAGVPVAKHGNRSVSSKSGSADVLETLGARIDLPKEEVEALFRQTGMTFMFAPLFHPALKYVMPVRRELGIRTFFNVMGPLLNPARVKRQVIGAFSKEVAKSMTQIMAGLESERTLGVHGSDGMDEFTVSGKSFVFEQGSDGTLSESTFHPQHLGLESSSLEALKGGDAGENAEILMRLFDGKGTRAQENVVLINAAHAILVSGKATSLKEAYDQAFESLKNGVAKRKLQDFVEASRSV